MPIKDSKGRELMPSLATEVFDYGTARDAAEKARWQMADRIEADLLSPWQRKALAELVMGIGSAVERADDVSEHIAERYQHLMSAPAEGGER